MTSASDQHSLHRPVEVALAPDVAVRITEVADRVAAGWGHDVHHTALTAIIADLYDDLAPFPGGWPKHRRQAFIAEASDTTACEVTSLLDEHLDTHAASGRGSPWHPAAEGCQEDTDATGWLSILTQEHLTWWCIDLLSTQIADHSADEPGRGEGSMTACGPAQRPPTTTVRLPPRRARQRP
jgi:hypothetical protein